MKKLKREDLSSGKVLEALLDRYYAEDNKDNLMAVLNCIKDSEFYIPVMVKMKDSDMDMFVKAKIGDTVTLGADMSFSPDILTNADGEKYMPIFSSMSQMPDEYREKLSTISKPCSYCFDMAVGIDDIKGIVLNGFTNYLALDKQIFEVIMGMPSMLL